jgi:hypothetical protein
LLDDPCCCGVQKDPSWKKRMEQIVKQRKQKNEFYWKT